MSSRKRTTYLFLLVATLLTGCVGGEQETQLPSISPSIESDVPLLTSTPSEEEILPSLTPLTGLPTPVSTLLSTIFPLPLVPPPGEEGEVPMELIDAIKSDLAARLGISLKYIEVVSAEAVPWNDGSLSCPEPGMAYIQVITPGYQVILWVDGWLYDYRATEWGIFKLCEND